MLWRLRRHSFPVRAHFRHSAVLTYAVSPSVLRPLLPPGLEIDCYNGFGFLAIALVQTERLRPAGLPAIFGQDFFLAGYRVFVRFRSASGRTLRGLRILRSSADRRLMVCAGNLLTHYNYELSRIRTEERADQLRITTRTPHAAADLDVRFDLRESTGVPEGSPFDTIRAARRFAGPLPYTFDYEAQTNSIIVIEGRRTNWNPRLVRADVRTNRFLEQFEHAGDPPILASAFHVADVDYEWARGRREPLGERGDNDRVRCTS